MWKEHSGKNTGWLASGFGRKNDTERGRLYTCLLYTSKEPESREAELFQILARQIVAGKTTLHKASPLSEEQMECFMRGENVFSSQISPVERKEEKTETDLTKTERCV